MKIEDKKAILDLIWKISDILDPYLEDSEPFDMVDTIDNALIEMTEILS